MLKVESKLIVIVVVIFGVTAFISCEKSHTVTESEIENTYSDLALSVKKGLDSIGENLREQNSTFTSKQSVLLSAEQYFIDTPDAYEAFLKNYKSTIKNSSFKSVISNDEIRTDDDDIEINLANK